MPRLSPKTSPRGGGVSDLTSVSTGTSENSSDNVYTADGQILYEGASDTIYIYNALQTAVSRQDDAAEQPVLTGDGAAGTFGTGQLIYPKGSSEYLTYSSEHSFVYVDGWADGLNRAGENNSVELLDADEEQVEEAPVEVESEASQQEEKADDAAAPQMDAEESNVEGGESAARNTEDAGDPSDDVDLLAAGDADGRDFAGQVVKKIDGVDYILIGNEQQLRAIGSDKAVNGKVFHYYAIGDNHEPTEYYVGDADLPVDQELRGEAFGEWGLGGESGYKYCGQNSTGAADKDVDANTGLKYSSDANYIIFRDIKLTDEWTPLMFSGTMTGAKVSAGQDKLWDDGSTSITATGTPSIDGLVVNQGQELDTEQYNGIGFFGTLSSQTDEYGMSLLNETAVVKNLRFESPRVVSDANEVKNHFSLIGSLLGWLVELLLGDSENLTYYATGILAGRVVGDVAIQDITIHNATLDNNNRGYTGGLAGYVTGSTLYEGVTAALGNVVNFLSYLLNVIPGLGLGDLIDLLLGNEGLIEVGKLIPVGYVSPTIRGCVVDGLVGTNDTPVGNQNGSYAGGLAGNITGAVVEDCEVKGGALSVEAKNYAGGFAGVVRNGTVEGTLNLDEIADLGTWTNVPQSLVYGSKVTSDSVSVTTAGAHAGGFAGALASAYMVSDSVQSDGAVMVDAGAGNAGGFAGTASLGWDISLGKQGDNESERGSLLGLVNDLLTDILSGKEPDVDADPLLSLVGIRESELLGVTVSGSSVAVTAANNAGGLVGDGVGTVIAHGLAIVEGSADGSTYWASEVPEQLKNKLSDSSVTPTDTRSSVTNLSSVVTTQGDNAGGIAGSLTVANGGGLINDTLGLNSVISFVVKGVDVSGLVAGETAGFSVTAKADYAAGGVAFATGGRISDVKISDIGSVRADNYAGGFLGAAGSGSVVSGGGINLLGLDIVKLGGLLNVGHAIQTTTVNVDVAGVSSGFTVAATGGTEEGYVPSAGAQAHSAGGFVGVGSALDVSSSRVRGLAAVTASAVDGEAGGFVGTSTASGLADSVSDADAGALLEIDSLLGAIDYLLPSYTDVDVTFVAAGHVDADTAGGFVGAFESGTVDNSSRKKANWYAVYGLDAVNGGAYAGGFGGNVYSGALADAGKGISILGSSGLSIDLTKLLKLVSAYVPTIKSAGVSSSERGLKVTADEMRDGDSNSGAAGGYIGYGSGVRVSNSDVSRLRHTVVEEPADLEGADGSTYFGSGSEYAVTAERYAGGYIGLMNIGSAASVGKGLGVLGTSIKLTDIAGALQVVASTIEHCDVNGPANGYAVLANGDSDGPVGYAGGFVGRALGGQIQDSNSYNFSHIVGQTAAGGYAGEIEPGAVADVLGDGSILNGLADVSNLASVLQSFVSSIRNSETTCIPCGGVVRAQGSSMVQDGATELRGMAGGYVGHNVGGQVWGNNTDSWIDVDIDGSRDDYSGPIREAAAIRIRSVYGHEYAGGFTGLMEAGSTASGGNLSLLWGLVEVNNLLDALKVAYATEECTAVYGPLSGLDMNTWNAWVEAVGEGGGYGQDLAANGEVSSEEELAGKLAAYEYGMNVVAGRNELAKKSVYPGGAAGGYVGAMVSGTITNGQAHDVRTVEAMRAAGGFVGSAQTGGAASLGSVGLFGGKLNLNLSNLLDIAEVFVPVMKSSSVEGWRAGMTVVSRGTGSIPDDISYSAGNAGGYIGYGSGAQIWGEESLDGVAASGCNAFGLRRVQASAYVGGYAGILTAGSAVNVNTQASDGFLQEVLDQIVDETDIGNLAEVLEDTMSTVRAARVRGFDDNWGYTVESGQDAVSGTGAYSVAAGGFAGKIEATVLGDKDNQTDVDTGLDLGIHAEGVRGVQGGLYAGGFVGLADVGSLADIAGSDDESGSVSILHLIGLGDTSLLDVFQPCIYRASVSGPADGLTVRAMTASAGGLLNSKRMSGNAGGFAGALMSGIIADSSVNSLNEVSGPCYTGGFVGYTGKTGVLDSEDASVLGDLLGVTAGVANIFSAIIERSSVTGVSSGYTVASTGVGVADDDENAQIAGGFAGNADIAHINDCHANLLKRVGSGETAGGFAGTTTFAYLVSAEVDSNLVEGIVFVVNKILDLLRAGELQELGALQITLPGDIGGEILTLKVLADGKTVELTLLGIDISVLLNEVSDDGRSGTVVVKIGDSEIRLSCDENGYIGSEEAGEVQVNLIKGNRAQVTNSSVTGVAEGYDVFGGGASQDSDGVERLATGYAGGFVGHNNEGKLSGNKMLFADVVRGTSGLTGPFTGKTDYSSQWWFNHIEDTEYDNAYHVYRDSDMPERVYKQDGTLVGTSSLDGTWRRYDVQHRETGKDTDVVALQDWQGAYAATSSDAPADQRQAIDVWISAAKAVLMGDVSVSDNTGGLTPEPGDGQDPCEASIDLTIQKIWDDGILGVMRPGEIEFVLSASYTDSANVPHTSYYDPVSKQLIPEDQFKADDQTGELLDLPTVTVSKSDADSLWSETWRKVIEGLPVATEDGFYYTYHVTELQVGAYASEVTGTDSKEQVITVTNTLRSLPDTGGAGTALIVAAGLLGMVAGGVWLEQQRRRRAADMVRRPSGSHFRE